MVLLVVAGMDHLYGGRHCVVADGRMTMSDLWTVKDGVQRPLPLDVFFIFKKVEPADIIELHPITDMGVMTHTVGEGENCRMEAHLPPGKYLLIPVEADDE